MIKCPVCNQMEIGIAEKRDFAGNLITTQKPGDIILPETATDCQLWQLYQQHTNNPVDQKNIAKLAGWIASLGYTKSGQIFLVPLSWPTTIAKRFLAPILLFQPVRKIDAKASKNQVSD